MRRPDDPPPQPAPKHVARYIILLILAGILTPFIVNRYRTAQLAGNEQAVVAMLRQISKAQNEYFAEKHEYAQSFSLLKGDVGGLPEMDEGAEEGGVTAPPKVDDPNVQSGMRKVASKASTPAYHGYRFRVLKGASGADGSKSFFDENGRMTAGYAILAVPERYGFTGRDTFMMLKGDIYVKDFDAHTDRVTRPLYHFTLPEGALKIQ